ncbi:MAG: ABC transporter ATP-binding protein [Candidatus Nomurabacteria bacterium]|jgi:putative ABC transport system ATP-binding protein|nr:ABC transporter ATP-binding protein [Candidatus Nomurabacteria bacterium]
MRKLKKNASPILEVKRLEKYYGNRNNLTKALAGISFEVHAGEYVGVMGASGSGKTTLLNCISTIDNATSGHISIGGKDITSLSQRDLAKFRREQLGFVFQDVNLLDTLTSYENIALALTILKKPADEIDSEVKKVAKLLDISQVLDRFPYQISGGQKQRVASARAIITKPLLVLADEPTGALDSKSAQTLLISFQQLVDKHNTTILMVTHDAFSASYCNRILFIRDGKLFTQLARGNDTRKQFFEKIIEVVSLLGGKIDDIT